MYYFLLRERVRKLSLLVACRLRFLPMSWVDSASLPSPLTANTICPRVPIRSTCKWQTLGAASMAWSLRRGHLLQNYAPPFIAKWLQGTDIQLLFDKQLEVVMAR